jgi:hypothetical protein
LHPPISAYSLAPRLPSIQNNVINNNEAINETINENIHINDNIDFTIHEVDDNEDENQPPNPSSQPRHQTVTIPSTIQEPDDPQPPREPRANNRRGRGNGNNNNGHTEYPNIHGDPWYDGPSTYSLRNIIIDRKRGITYHPKLIAPEAAGDWLRRQKEKGLLEGWRMESGDFDNDENTTDNVIFKDEEGDDRIIDGYEITDGNKKRYNQNLLRNFPYETYVRKKPVFPMIKDFYNQPKPIIDDFDGKAHNWVQWRKVQPAFSDEYMDSSPLMINVLVRTSLEGIVWKEEFEPNDYDPSLILRTYQAVRSRLKRDYDNLDRTGFFDADHRRQNLYNMFKGIYINKLNQKRHHPGSPNI